ncbi:MAG: CBS domain-containing protein, partial [Flavobacteriaceae bacterium]
LEKGFSTISRNMTLGEMLIKSVSKSKRNIFPVLDENQALVGIVTLDNIREFMFDSGMYDKITVESFMHQAPEHIFYEDDSMQAVMDKFQRSEAWNLPVIKDGRYLGFISKSKLMTAYRTELINFTREDED